MKTPLIRQIVFFVIAIPFNFCLGQISDSTIFPWTYYVANYDTDSTSIPGEGDHSDDLLLDDVWLCDALQGGAPYDIIYVNDLINGHEVYKIFVYTERKLIIIDENTKDISGSIELSNHGSQSHFKVSDPYSDLIRSREKHLAYNQDKHELYCLTQDFKIKIINPYLETITGEISPQVYSHSILWAILKYNPQSGQIFLSCTYPIFSGQLQSKLIVVSAEDYLEDYTLTFDKINDFSFNPEHDIMYLSNSQNIELIEASSGSPINTYSMNYPMGVIINAYNHSNLNKIYCLPKDKSSTSLDALIFDGNNTNAQYLTVQGNFFTCGVYNPDEDRMYLGYSANSYNQSGVLSFIPGDPLDQSNNELGLDLILDIESSGNKVFVGSRNSIYVFKNGTHFTSYDLTSRSSFFFRMATSSHFGEYIFDADLTSQSIEFCYSAAPLQTFQWEEPIVCGGVAYHGFYDAIHQKLYLYNGHDLGNHLLYIYDKTNGNVDRLDIGTSPTSLAFDSDDNIVYLASNADVIKRLDASDNTWLSDILLPLEFDYCSEIYFKHDGKLFCSASNLQQNDAPAILVYEVDVSLTNPEIIPDYITFNSSGYNFDTHFDYDEENDRVFVSMRDNLNGLGFVMVIFSNYSYLLSPGIGLPDEIIYNAHSNKLFIRHNYLIPVLLDWISILDYNVQPPNIETFYPRQGVSVSDIEMDPNSNLLYVTYDDPSGDVDIFSTEGELINTVHIANRTGTMKYNPINNLMYVHVPFNYSYDKEEQLWSIEPSTYSTANLSLQQNEGYWNNPKFYLIDLILDESSNILYSCNGQGNIKAIQCHADRIRLGDGWSWISFPRLNRDPSLNLSVPAETVLNERIKPGPDTQYFGTMKYLLYDELLGHERMIEIKKLTYSEPWNPETGDLDSVSSTKGYQISTRDPQEYIELYGDIQDLSVPVELIGNFENWAGYFLTNAQHPVHAIPPETRDNLTWMAGQYWYCYNQNPYPDGSGGLWRCARNEGEVEVKYGDMIKLYSSVNGSFSWQQNTPSVPGIDKPPSELFVYEEQADYNAYFLELDTTDLPDEIGAMVNDTCIGATKVFPGEDTVLICAYTEGFEGEQVSFQFAYSTKSDRPRILEYSVLNNLSGIKEQRRMRIGENQPYYFISFKDASRETSGPGSGWINCYPNPASREVIVDFFLDKEGDVTLQLVSTVGNVISSWSLGAKIPGNYHYTFPTSDIPGGYYLVSLSAGNQIHTNKLCIIH